MGNSSLNLSFLCLPRGGAEDVQYRVLCSHTSEVLLHNMLDRWAWSLSAYGDFLLCPESVVGGSSSSLPGALIRNGSVGFLTFAYLKPRRRLLKAFAIPDRANIRKNAFVEEFRYKPFNNDHFTGSYVFVVKQGSLNNDKEKEAQPALVLDESCYLERDFSLSLVGKTKEFSSLSNLKVVLAIEGKVYWIRAKEVNGWNPDFMEEEETQTESDNAIIQNDSDVDEIPENKGVKETPSEDPFGIYDLLHKN
ncbi:hypothetical protein Tco_1226615 [Tanacetum coccineum]